MKKVLLFVMLSLMVGLTGCKREVEVKEYKSIYEKLSGTTWYEGYNKKELIHSIRFLDGTFTINFRNENNNNSKVRNCKWRYNVDENGMLLDKYSPVCSISFEYTSTDVKKLLEKLHGENSLFQEGGPYWEEYESGWIPMEGSLLIREERKDKEDSYATMFFSPEYHAAAGYLEIEEHEFELYLREVVE